MKPHYLFHSKLILFLIAIFVISCTEQPIESELDVNLKIDTLSISQLSLSSYTVAPNLATNNRLYLGKKNGIEVPLSFIKIGSSGYWSYYYDSTITIDSIQFKLYFDDSSHSSESYPSLYFSPDSHFNENSSTYLDFDEFSTVDWYNLGEPNIINNTDTNNAYTYSELIWGIDTLAQVLADTAPSVARTFVIKFDNNNSNFIELFSEEASIEEKDPKVILFYRKTNIFTDDSVSIDTLSNSIYSSADLSIFDPRNSEHISDEIGVSNGLGTRSLLNFSFSIDSMQQGSIIRKADLIIPIDSSTITGSFNIIIDPIVSDSLTIIDSTGILAEDPYIGIGYPYRLSNESDSLHYIVSIKNILQNIILGNSYNYGFKIVSDEKNDPFDSIWFLLNDSSNQPRVQITYVYNDE